MSSLEAMAAHLRLDTRPREGPRPGRLPPGAIRAVAEFDQVRDRLSPAVEVVAGNDVNSGQVWLPARDHYGGHAAGGVTRSSLSGIVPRHSKPSTRASMKASRTDEFICN